MRSFSSSWFAIIPATFFVAFSVLVPISAEAVQLPNTQVVSPNLDGQPPVTSAPDSPTNVTVTAVGNTSINVSWTAPVNNGGSPIVGYLVREYMVDGTQVGSESNVGTNTSLSFSDALFNGTIGSTYYVTVSTINSLGVSVETSANPKSTFLVALAPEFPTGFKLLWAGPNKLLATWNEAGDNGAPLTGYKINIYDKTDTIVGSVSVEGNQTTSVMYYSTFNLSPGESYYGRISASNLVGESDYNTPNTDSVFTIPEPLTQTETGGVINTPGNTSNSVPSSTSNPSTTPTPTSSPIPSLNSLGPVQNVPVVGFSDLTASLSKTFGIPQSEFTLTHLMEGIGLLLLGSIILGWIFKRPSSR